MRFCGRATETEAPWHCPRLVLVHGGQHAGDCWDQTVDEIHRAGTGSRRARARPARPPRQARRPSQRPHRRLGRLIARRHRRRGHRRVRHRRPLPSGTHRARCGDEARPFARQGDGARRGFRAAAGLVGGRHPARRSRLVRTPQGRHGHVGHNAERVGGVCFLQRDDARAAQVQPRSVPRRVAVDHLRQRRPIRAIPTMCRGPGS